MLHKRNIAALKAIDRALFRIGTRVFIRLNSVTPEKDITSPETKDGK